MPDFFVIRYNPVTSKYDAVNGPNANATFTAVNGTDANGLAALQDKQDGKYVSFPVAGAAKAELQTNLPGSNDDLLFTAVTPGTGGNSIRVRYVVAGNNTALSVSVSGNDITVNVATNGAGAATSTASQVKTAVDASGPATALVSTAIAPGNDGTGVVSALGYTNLSGGNVGGAVATNTSVVQSADSVVTSF